jgi:hypothetical protein
VAKTGSPSKYAARCSNSVKSSTVISARCEPKILLQIHAPQRRRVDAMSKFLWPDVADQMSARIGVAIRMAVEAGYAETRPLGPAVVDQIELLLGKRREQEPQPILRGGKI